MLVQNIINQMESYCYGLFRQTLQFRFVSAFTKLLCTMISRMEGFCLGIEYMIMLLLAITSVLISKEVWDQYQSKATSFKQSQRVITEAESVTLVLSFWPLKKIDYPASVPYQSYEQWQLNSDFNLTFGVTAWKTVQEEILLVESNQDLSINHSSIGKVKFDKLMSKWGDFYKISANLIHVKQPYDAFLKIDFSNHIPDERIPDLITVFSSENSSYGKILSDWLEGDIVYMNKIKGFRSYRFQPQEVTKMKSKHCQDGGYYECFHSKLISEDYSHCPKKCLAISTTVSDTLPLCQTEKEYQCAYEIVKKLHADNSSTKCLPSCTRIDFKQLLDYKEDQDLPTARRNIFIKYSLQNDKMKVEEEFLLHDFVDMLGSIGGTLGMCIGFSFVGLSSFLLNHLQIFFGRFLRKKSASHVDGMDEKIIKVENKLPKSEELDNNHLELALRNFQMSQSNIESNISNIMKSLHEIDARILCLEDQQKALESRIAKISNPRSKRTAK